MDKGKRLILLAAGMGTRLRPITEDRPKCLVPVAGKPILEWTIEAAQRAGFEDIVLVGGYRHQMLENYGCTLVVNEMFDTTNMVESLFVASEYFGSGFTLCYGDIICRDQIFQQLGTANGEINIVADLDWLDYWQRRFADPLEDAESFRFGGNGTVAELGQTPNAISEIEGQYIGLVSFNATGVAKLTQTYEACRKQAIEKQREEHFTSIYMTDLLQLIIEQNTPISAVPIRGGWLEIDSISDLRLAEELITQGRLG